MSLRKGMSRMYGRGMAGLSRMQGSRAYQGMTNTFGEKLTVSLTYGQVLLITMLAASYLVVASLGIDVFNRCTELKGVKLQENLNKWIVATLAIAIAIPCTLLTVRAAGTSLSGLMMLLFAVFGIVASSALIHWNRKCSDVEESEKIYGGINLAVFVVMLLVAGFLLRPASRNNMYM